MPLGIMNGRIQGTNRIYFEADFFRGIDIKKGYCADSFYAAGAASHLGGKLPLKWGNITLFA